MSDDRSRAMLEAVSHGHTTPLPCGEHEAGVTAYGCNCLDKDEAIRRLTKALTAVLDLCDRHAPHPLPPKLLREVIAKELEKP